MAISFTTFIKGLLIKNDADITKQVLLEANSAATTGTKTTITTAQTANRTVTLPDATDTLVGKQTTDTLVNKTLDNTTVATIKDSNLTLQDNSDITKQTKFEVSGVTAGQTRVMTIPDGDTTLVGTGLTQTLAAKTLDNTNVITVKDTNLTIQDDGDTTKQVKFQASSVATGTTRTITMPDADLTLVGVATTQTLTGKTIDGDDNTVQDLPITAIKTNLTDASKFMVRDASGIPTSATKAVPTGVVVGTTDTQILTNKTLSGNTATNLISGSGTLTLNTTGTVTVPNATDTLVGKATTDILTNKTLNGNTATNLISGSGTLTLNTSGTVTLPNATDTLVGKATTDILTNKSIDAATNTITNISNTEIKAAAAIAVNKLAAQTVSRALVSDGSGFIAPATTTATEIGFVNGVTSAIQTQINTKAPTASPTFTGTVTTPLTTAGPVITSSGGVLSSEASLAIARGGTNNAALAVTAGGVLYTDGSKVVNVGAGVAGQALKSNGASAPSWGAAGSGGSKNYLGVINNTDNGGDFEANTVGSWVTGVTGALTNGLPTTTPTFGSGANANYSISVAGASTVSGTYSLAMISLTASTAGNMFSSPAFTIDFSDLAKVMTVKFNYRVISNPTNANWSGTSSNSFAWAIYDVANTSWIIPTGSFGMTQSALSGTCTGTFQTSATGTLYRLVVYNANATAGAIQVNFDDFSVGPQTALIGGITTDPVTFTPTGGWASNATYTGRWWRTGAFGHYEYKITCTGAPTGTLTLNLPSGHVIDTTQLPGGAAVNQPMPNSVVRVDNGTNYFGAGAVSYATTTSVTPTAAYITTYAGTTATKTDGAVTASFPITFASTNSVYVSFSAPISGWSSSTTCSNDTDTRVVDFYGLNSATTSYTGTTITLPYTATLDTHGAWATNTYTIPVSGKYQILAETPIYQNTVGGGNSFQTIYVNGSAVKNTYASMPTQNAALVQTTTYEAALNAGDTIQVKMSNSSGGMQLLGSTVGASASLTIRRASGPAVIAATESVNARYTTVTGQTIATSTATTMTGWVKDYDSHNAFSSTTYTVPVSGKYEIHCSALFAGTSMATGGVHATLYIVKNGSTVSVAEGESNVNVNEGASVTLSDILNFVAGDTIVLQISQGNGGNRALSTGAGYNRFAIARIGN